MHLQEKYLPDTFPSAKLIKINFLLYEAINILIDSSEGAESNDERCEPSFEKDSGRFASLHRHNLLKVRKF